MKSFKELMLEKSMKPDKRNSYEYQAYGNKLAEEFEDTPHRALYIKLAKNENRVLLEKARDHVKNSEKATTKGKLFMWKLTQLKKELNDRNK